MSLVSNLLHWALDAAKTQAQQAVLTGIKAGATQLTTAIAKGAPDVATFAISKINEGVDHAVAGVMTQRTK